MKLTSLCSFAVLVLAAAGCGNPSAQGELKAEPQSVDFGDVAVGSQVERTISLTVSNQAEVSISGLDITGDGAAAFEVLDVVSVVRPGVPAPVKIRFHAGTVVGAQTAVFKVQSVNAAALSIPLQVRVVNVMYSSWSTFGACSSTCGPGIERRTRTCVDSNAASIDCQQCGGVCTEDRACNGTTGCNVPTYTAWTAWTACTSGMQSRQRTCELNGATAPCGDCGGQCTQNQGCGTCASYGVNAVNCASKPDCDALLASKQDSCQAAGCTWSGSTVCTIGGSASSTTCNGGTGSCQ